MSDTPEIAGAKRRLELQATELPNWARQLLDYIAKIERELGGARVERSPRTLTITDRRTPSSTDADYAVEHAGYLADAAGAFIELCNLRDAALLELEDVDSVEGPDCSSGCRLAVENVTTAYSESMSALREAVYEFEKRRDRALENVTPVVQGQDLRAGMRVRYLSGTGYNSAGQGLAGRVGTVVEPGAAKGVWCVKVDDFPNDASGDNVWGARREWVEIIGQPDEQPKMGIPADPEDAAMLAHARAADDEAMSHGEGP